MAVSGKTVSFQCLGRLDAWVNPFIGYALERLVVPADFKGGAISEAVKVVTSESAAQPHDCLSTLWVYPILPYFQIGGICLHPLAKLGDENEHPHHLITSLCCYHVEVGFLFADSLGSGLDLNPPSAVGTGGHTFICRPFVTARHTYGFPILQAIGEVSESVVERPLHLGGGEWAKLPTQCHYLFLLFGLGFHSGKF